MKSVKRSVFLLAMTLPVLAGCAAKGGTIRLTGADSGEWVAACAISYDAYTSNKDAISADGTDYKSAQTAAAAGEEYVGKYWAVFTGTKTWNFSEDGDYFVSAIAQTSGKTAKETVLLVGGDEVTVTLK